MLQKREISLDVIRILALGMIVLMHSPMPSANAPGTFLAAVSYATAPGIGLFFMVSGALLLPVKTDYLTFIKRRLSKILLPTLLWTFIYMALNLYYSQWEINIVRSLLSIPFSSQGHGVLWFMYTLTGLYLLAPILSAWLEKASVKEVEAVLMLWIISLCYPVFENLLDINQSTTGLLYYFTGYAGYFLLGYYLRRYGNRLTTWIPAAVSLTGVCLAVYLQMKSIEVDFYRLFWYESIFIAALACLIWQIVRALMSRFENQIGTSICLLISVLSKLVFGVYLMHILIMRYFLSKIGWISDITNYPLQTFVIASLTLIISGLLCYLISKIPYLNVLIGYRANS